MLLSLLSFVLFSLYVLISSAFSFSFLSHLLSFSALFFFCPILPNISLLFPFLLDLMFPLKLLLLFSFIPVFPFFPVFFLVVFCLVLFSVALTKQHTDLHRSAATLKPLRSEVNNIDHHVTMQSSAGKPSVLEFMWMPIGTHHPNTISDQVPPVIATLTPRKNNVSLRFAKTAQEWTKEC